MADEPGSLDLTRFNELLLESVGVGLAVVAAESLEIRFRNRRFVEWFPTPVPQADAGAGAAPGAGDGDGVPANPPPGPDRLDVLIPKLDVAAMREATSDDGTYRAEVEVKPKRRALSIALGISRHDTDGEPLLVVECQNISKIKELEYMVESYSRMVDKHTRDLKKEKERVERLLLNIMPKTVYEEWKVFGVTAPQRYERAGVLMMDFAGFTDMDISRDPPALISELNDLFTTFDRIVEQFGGERIKTIGDAYMAVCGIPEPGMDDVQSVARIALRIARYLERRNASRKPEWRARIGIAAGSVIGSIVGVQKYVYDIFGPGVNLAARMEETAQPMQIVFPEDMYDELREEFHVSDLGVMEIKGFGQKRIYSLDGSRDVTLATHHSPLDDLD